MCIRNKIAFKKISTSIRILFVLVLFSLFNFFLISGASARAVDEATELGQTCRGGVLATGRLCKDGSGLYTCRDVNGFTKCTDTPSAGEGTRCGGSAAGKGELCKDESGDFRCVKDASGIPRCVKVSDATKPTTIPTIKPRLSIPIPTVLFTDIAIPKYDPESEDTVLQTIDIPFLAQYISGVYKYAVGFASVIAAVMMMIGGFQYLTAGGDQGRVTAGKEKISNALIGLFLSLGSYLILFTINPALTQLNALKLKVVRPQLFSSETSDPGDAEQSVTGKKLCGTTEECLPICLKHCNKNGGGCTYSESVNASIMTVDKITPKLTCIKTTNSRIDGGPVRLTPATIEGLREICKAIDILKKSGELKGQNYSLTVSSGWRPISTQLSLACPKIVSGNTDHAVNKSIAWPGGSNHGLGIAIDVTLFTDGKQSILAGECPQQTLPPNPKFKPTTDELKKIMSKAGWMKLKTEEWHYEYKGKVDAKVCEPTKCGDAPANCGKKPKVAK